MSWTSRVRNNEVLQRSKEERNILHTMRRLVALRRNCALKRIIGGNIGGGSKIADRHEELAM